MKKVSQMMRDYREKRGITQTHVAKQAGINPKRISQLETGLVRLTADEFLQICIEGFGVTPQIFLTTNSRKTRAKRQTTPTIENHRN